jgi:hypothetical protein
MEFASIEDAFPQEDLIKKKGRKERKKEGFLAYELPPTDPDRPAVKRMSEISPINSRGVNEDFDINDESSDELKKKIVSNSLIKPGTFPLKNTETPSYFGAEPFANPDDSYAIYNANQHKQSSYMLEADFTKTFEESGYEKSSGKILPSPELRQRWKPLSSDRIESSFTNDSKGPQFEGISSNDFNAMRSKLDTLMARLDDLENRADGANPQLEMLSFIMTGLFLMFALDLTVKNLSR